VWGIFSIHRDGSGRPFRFIPRELQPRVREAMSVIRYDEINGSYVLRLVIGFCVQWFGHT
jgi:hypothetical protein